MISHPIALAQYRLLGRSGMGAWSLPAIPSIRVRDARPPSRSTPHEEKTSMRSPLIPLLLTAVMGGIPAAQATAQSRPVACAASGASSPAALHRDWILVGWEKHRGDPPFDFRQKLGHLYHWDSSDVRLYDNFDPQHRLARSASEWSEVWTEPFNALTEARHSVLDGPDVIDGGSLSASTLEFAARLEKAGGEIIGARARSSLVWQCTSTGWKIVREHTSLRLVSREEIDAIVPHPTH